MTVFGREKEGVSAGLLFAHASGTKCSLSFDGEMIAVRCPMSMVAKADGPSASPPSINVDGEECRLTFSHVGGAVCTLKFTGAVIEAGCTGGS